MKKVALCQCFKPHKHIKTEYSLQENIAHIWEWKHSKVKLKSVLFKIDRNKRVAIFLKATVTIKVERMKFINKESKKRVWSFYN